MLTYLLTYSVAYLLTYLLTCLLITHLLTYLLTYLVTYLVTCLLIYVLAYLLTTYSCTYSLVYLLSYLVTCLLNCLLIYLLTYILTYLLTYLLAYLLIYLLAYLLTYLHTYFLMYIHTYIHTYIYAKRSYLYCEDSIWGKTDSQGLFDVTMGSWDGAETCELVGAYILSQVREKHGNDIGLYRDDGLGAFEATPQRIERIKKSLCKIFKDNGLKITIEANLDVVNFLDITLNLTRNSFAPYAKPGNTTVYIHARSNHPPNITKNIPLAINKRLVELSSNEEAFENAKPPYQEALRKSGYQHELKYEQVAQKKQARKNRPRNIVWYNPPFSSNVKTNIGKAFIQTIKQSFPPGHPLRKIYNTNTLKLSYSCMPNVKNVIDGHNKKIRDESKKNKEQESQEKTCNCRKPADCPLNGQCLTKSVIYQATVTTEDDGSKETYIGLTKNTFKEQFNGHKTTFRHSNKRNNTELSKYYTSGN